MRDSPRFPRLALAVMIAAALVACSDDDDGEGNGNSRDDPAEGSEMEAGSMPARLGVIRVASRAPATVPAASAVFVSLQEPATTNAALRAQLFPEPNTCVLQSDLTASLVDGATGLDAGEILTLTDANGTYAGIERTSRSDSEFIYRLGGGAVTPPMGELVLDIPGGDSSENAFPAVAATPFPTVGREPTLLSPQARTRVLSDTVFRWNAAEQNADERAFLMLVVNFTNEITNAVLCALSDDEEFVLPAVTIEALEARDEVSFDGSIGSVLGFGAMRIDERQVDDDTLLLMRNMRFTELPSP